MPSDVITTARELGLTVTVATDGIPMAICLRCSGTGFDWRSLCPTCDGTGEVELAWLICWLTACAEVLHAEGEETRAVEEALPF